MYVYVCLFIYAKHTNLYKEIKALCGLNPTSRRPNDRWCLTKALMRRENGLGMHMNNGNQLRRIANLFVPNKKDKRLMWLESKVFVSKLNKDGSKLITGCQGWCFMLFKA